MDLKRNIKLLGSKLLPAAVRRQRDLRRLREEVEVHGEAELPELRKFVTPGSLVVDVGCNMGVYAYELSRLADRVIAFEPNPTLAHAIRRLKLRGVEVRQAAVSDEAGTAELLIPTIGGHIVASLDERVVKDRGALERVSVPVERLDDVVRGKVDFIKIDVEGLEERVLSGAQRILADDRPRLLIEIEERHNSGGLSRIVTYLQAFKYAGYFLKNGRWLPVSGFDPATDQDVPTVERMALPRRQTPYYNNFLFTASPLPALS